MGEAAVRSRSKAAVLAGEPRCIYCATENLPKAHLTLEHMPPIGLFRDRFRASGMEYSSCEACNVGTKGADAAGTCMSLIAPREQRGDWKLDALERMMPALDKFAQPFKRELVESSMTRRWMWTPQGLIQPHVQISADGPIVKAYLSVFSAKLAMALYREHTGSALPLDGAVYTIHFLNAGLSKEYAESMLRMMPIFGHLKQGRNTSLGQFEYRFNSDDRSIVAALSSFHHNLHVLSFSTADPETYGFVSDMPHMTTTKPGELVGRLAKADALAGQISPPSP